MDSCHILISSDAPPLSSKQLENVFERKNDLEMVSTMRSIFQQLCNGEDVDPYIIPIIKNVSTSTCKPLKRILHMFWPQIDCYYPTGALKPHMILVCNSILQDLKYPNEFIVASALRCVMNFNAKEVIQHLVQAIPPLLRHQSEEVRATAAVAIQQLNQRFPGLVSLRILEEQSLEEKSPMVARHFINCLAQVDQQFFQQNIQQIAHRFQFFGVDSEVGIGVLSNFDALPAAFGQELINQLKTFQQFPAQIYQQAGRSLAARDKVLAAQFLLISCRESPPQIVQQVVQIISGMNIQDLPNAGDVAQTLAQVFTSHNLADEDTQMKLFQTRLFQKICINNMRACKQIVDSLTSSRIMETENDELYYMLVNTVFEVAAASDGFASITVAGLQQLSRICYRNKAASGRYFTEACQIVISIIQQCAERMASHGDVQKLYEILKLSCRIVFQCCNHEVFKAAIWAFVQVLYLVQDDHVKQQFGATILLLLDVPQEIAMTENNDTVEFLKQNIAPLLFTPKGADDDDDQLLPVYLNIKQGKHSFLTSIMTSAGRRMAYMFAHDSFLVQQILIGLAHMVKKTTFMPADEQVAYQNMQDIYLYASKNIIVAKDSTERDQQRAVDIKLNKQVCAEKPLLFSIFPTNTTTQGQQESKKTLMTVGNPYEMLSQNPELIYDIYQLSADADMIYAEALVVSNKTQILLSVLFVNRTDEVIEQLELELFTSNNLKSYQQPKKLSLEANQSVIQTYELSITQCTSAIIYGNIIARFSTPKLRDRHKDVIMRIKEIQFGINQFIKVNKLTLNEFRRLWGECEYEFKCNTVRDEYGIQQFEAEMEKINMSSVMIQQLEDDDECYGHALFSGMTIMGEMVLVVFGCSTNKSCKVRSANRDVCEGICQYINEL